MPVVDPMYCQLDLDTTLGHKTKSFPSRTIYRMLNVFHSSKIYNPCCGAYKIVIYVVLGLSLLQSLQQGTYANFSRKHPRFHLQVHECQ